MSNEWLRAFNDKVNKTLWLAIVLNISIFYCLFCALLLFVPIPLMTLLCLLEAEAYGWALAWVVWNCWSWLVFMVFLRMFEIPSKEKI